MKEVKSKSVSFDFDSTLDREDVQEFAKQLIKDGFDVWVTTSRGNDDEINKLRRNPQAYKFPANHDLYIVTDKIGIPRKRIKFTAWVDKWTVLKGERFLFHLDDDEIEIEQAELNGADLPFINVELPDWLEKCKKAIK